jgi:hypothetical protein
MWYRKIIVVCFDSHTKQINCIETADFMKDNCDGIHNNFRGLKKLYHSTKRKYKYFPVNIK